MSWSRLFNNSPTFQICVISEYWMPSWSRARFMRPDNNLSFFVISLKRNDHQFTGYLVFSHTRTKCHTEGHRLPVQQGAKKTLTRYRSVFQFALRHNFEELLELHIRSGNSARMITLGGNFKQIGEQSRVWSSSLLSYRRVLECCCDERWREETVFTQLGQTDGRFWLKSNECLATQNAILLKTNGRLQKSLFHGVVILLDVAHPLSNCEKELVCNEEGKWSERNSYSFVRDCCTRSEWMREKTGIQVSS
jgi:hypothetical protein